jgi:hypothetical protein
MISVFHLVFSYSFYKFKARGALLWIGICSVGIGIILPDPDPHPGPANPDPDLSVLAKSKAKQKIFARKFNKGIVKNVENYDTLKLTRKIKRKYKKILCKTCVKVGGRVRIRIWIAMSIPKSTTLPR